MNAELTRFTHGFFLRPRLAGASFALGTLVACSHPAALPPAPPRVAVDSRWLTPPAIATEPEVRLPWNVMRTKLSNGVGLTVVARPDSRTAAVILRVPGVRDPTWGPVTIMADALRAGTVHDKEVWFNPRLGQVQVNVMTDASGTTFGWEVLSAAAQPAVDMLAQFVLYPAFIPYQLTSVLERDATWIQLQSMQLELHLIKIVKSRFPGLELPTFEQDVLDLPHDTRERLFQIHRCTMLPEGAELVVVGPVDAERVRGWAEQAFGAWHGSAALPECAPWRKPPSPEHPELVRLDRPQLEIVRSGQHDPLVVVVVRGPGIDSPDFLPFVALTHALEDRDAGTAHTLREQGSTYGLHSSVGADFASVSLLTLSGYVEPLTARTTIQQLLDDVKSIGTNLEQPELESVKRRWRTSLLEGFAHNGAVAERVLWQLRRGRDPRELPTLLDEIAAVDLAACRAVAERWLSHAEPSIGVSGLGEKVASGLGNGADIHEAYWDDDPRNRRKRLGK